MTLYLGRVWGIFIIVLNYLLLVLKIGNSLLLILSYFITEYSSGQMYISINVYTTINEEKLLPN